MKLHLILWVGICMGLFHPLSAQFVFWTEEFETDGHTIRYQASSGGGFNDGLHDHFRRTNGSDIAAISSAYTGMNGAYFWAAEDTDDDGGDGNPVQTIAFTGIDISGFTAVNVKGLFGVGNNGLPGLSAYDAADYIRITYQIDGGPVQNGLWFSYENHGDPFNEPLGLDADFDGQADVNGVNRLTSNLQEFQFLVPNGNALDLTIEVRMNGADEAIAFDQLSLTGTPVGCYISDISVANASVCNDNGTPGDATDDFFTADVLVDFVNLPATGTLELTGDGISSISVNAITGNSYTFNGVQLKADQTLTELTAHFSAMGGCSRTEWDVYPAVAPCTPTVGFGAPISKCLETSGVHVLSICMDVAPSSAVGVQIAALLGGTATGGGVDYNFVSQNLVFLSTESYPNTKYAYVDIIDDFPIVDEGETILLGLTLTAGVASTSFTNHTITIGERETGLMLNEFSQGSSGGKEYIELLVVGEPATTVDLRGWIIDDNNGDFSDGTGQDLGISSGYVSFANHCNWEKVPVGAIIVLYNGEDPNPALPPDDPYDINGDGIYVLPISGGTAVGCSTPLPNELLKAHGAIPNLINSAYPMTNQDPCWSLLSFRNMADAVQVREPSGNYFHGMSYGWDQPPAICTGSVLGSPCEYKKENHPDYLAYGAEVLYFLEAGANRTFSFTHTYGDDYHNRVNWETSTSSAQTPGLPNNSSNQNFIQTLKQTFVPTQMAATDSCVWKSSQHKSFLSEKDQLILHVENLTTLDHDLTKASVSFSPGESQNTSLSGQPFFASANWQLIPSAFPASANYNITMYMSDSLLTEIANFVNVNGGFSYTSASIVPLIHIYRRDGLAIPSLANSDAEVEILLPVIGSLPTTEGVFTSFSVNGTKASTYAMGIPMSVLAAGKLDFQLNQIYPGTVMIEGKLKGRDPTQLFIERKKDGYPWSMINHNNSSLTTRPDSSYYFMDHLSESGYYYYRIAVSDNSNKRLYSEIKQIEVLFEKQLSALSCFVNPWEESLNIVIRSDEERKTVWINVWTIEGKKIQEKRFRLMEGINEFSWPMVEFPSGIYLVKISTGSEQLFRKFVKN